MKLLAVERFAGKWPAEAATALTSAEVALPMCLPVTLMTDSAMVRRGMPMFVPDFAQGWDLEVVPFFSLGRLGKSISPRFAPRYINGWGVAVRAVPPGMFDCREGYVPGALAVNFDGAVAPGEVFPFENAVDAGIEVDGCGVLHLPWADMHVEDTVALASRYMMLKTGDIVMPCRTGLKLPVKLDTKLEGRLNGKPALSLKIK